jgi:SAM-dependent methyltransferase
MPERPYRVIPYGAERADEAREFWRRLETNAYYAEYQPQSLLLIHLLQSMGATSALELGCNVGRNVHWIAQTLPEMTVAGFDVNGDAVERGRDLFGLTETQTWVDDERALWRLPDDAYDVVFTVSVLDHVPRIATLLQQMVRVARRQVICIELALPEFGVVDDERVVGFSYSHDYEATAELVQATTVRRERAPLGEGILRYYDLFVFEASSDA